MIIQTPRLEKEDIKKIFPKLNNIEVLRQGGQKQVFKILDPKNIAVIKFVHVGSSKSNGEEFDMGTLKRLIREIKLISSVSSKYLSKSGPIPPGHYTKGNEIFYYYSEEYVDGPDLRTLISKNSFPKKAAPMLLKNITSGIKTLWEEGKCVHRDIKPENIMYDKTHKKFVLIDPGLALFLYKSSLTPIGFPPVGTLPYLSPEQIKGVKRKLDFRSDLYSLGVLIYEAVTGKHPYCTAGMSREKIIENILYKKPKPLTPQNIKLPETFLAVIDKMLNKNPHLRFNSCDKILKIV